MNSIVDMCFTKSEINKLQSYGLKSPSALDDHDKIDCLKIAKKVLHNLACQKGGLSTQGHDSKIKTVHKMQVLLRIYINIIKKGDTTSAGVHKLGYGGRFGLIRVQLPLLIRKKQLIVWKDGTIVMNTKVDDDTVTILTKRLNKNKEYSIKCNEIIDQLVKHNIIG